MQQAIDIINKDTTSSDPSSVFSYLIHIVAKQRLALILQISFTGTKEEKLR